MDLRLKPVRIKIKPKGDFLQIETSQASVTIPKSDFAFLTQGLAYNPRPVEVDAPNQIRKAFVTAVDSQKCLGHLNEPISPFLYNYLINKFGVSNSRFSLESLINELNGTSRVLFCGAGPSLYQTWDFVEFCLRTGYARVIAGGSAVKAFSDKGLVPDLCIACDPNATAPERFDLPESFTSKTILLAESGTHPAILANWKGPQVVTNGLAAFPGLINYTEPGRLVLKTGGIGVSTFAMEIAKAIGAKELLLLGVDLNPTTDGKLYPSDLGFENSIDEERNNIWRCEALVLGNTAKEMPYSVKNLAVNGRDIPNTDKISMEWIECEGETLPKLSLTAETQQEDTTNRIRSIYDELNNLDLKDVSNSKIFAPLLSVYHSIYTSRMLLTGEYPADSMLLRIEYIKGHLENIILGNNITSLGHK